MSDIQIDINLDADQMYEMAKALIQKYSRPRTTNWAVLKAEVLAKREYERHLREDDEIPL